MGLLLDLPLWRILFVGSVPAIITAWFVDPIFASITVCLVLVLLFLVWRARSRIGLRLNLPSAQTRLRELRSLSHTKLQEYRATRASVSYAAEVAELSIVDPDSNRPVVILDIITCAVFRSILRQLDDVVEAQKKTEACLGEACAVMDRSNWTSDAKEVVGRFVREAKVAQNPLRRAISDLVWIAVLFFPYSLVAYPLYWILSNRPGEHSTINPLGLAIELVGSPIRI